MKRKYFLCAKVFLVAVILLTSLSACRVQSKFKLLNSDDEISKIMIVEISFDDVGKICEKELSDVEEFDSFLKDFHYDAAGNITQRKEYAYTTGDLGKATKTSSYSYGDSSWGDLLTAYDGKTITYGVFSSNKKLKTYNKIWSPGKKYYDFTE